MPSQTGSIDLTAAYRANEAAAQTATNYIQADATGIRIANDNPSIATTYQHLTYDDTDFVVEGASKLNLSGSGIRIGETTSAHIIQSDSVMSFYGQNGTGNTPVKIIDITTNSDNQGSMIFNDGLARIDGIGDTIQIASMNDEDNSNSTSGVVLNAAYYEDTTSAHGTIQAFTSPSGANATVLMNASSNIDSTYNSQVAVDKDGLYISTSGEAEWAIIHSKRIELRADYLTLMQYTNPTTSGASIWRNAIFGVSNGVVPASLGGTGNTSLQATRNAMGLGNTTGALPVANGGTGQTGSTSTNCTLTSGITGTLYQARKWGNTVTLFLNAIKLNAALSNGAVTGTLLTVPSGYRPANAVYAVVAHSDNGVAYAQVTSAGAVTLRNRTGSSIASGSTFSVTITYVL